MTHPPEPMPIADCPNPECGKPCAVMTCPHKGFETYSVGCHGTLENPGCAYGGPLGYTKEEAIRLHNALCRPTAPDDGQCICPQHGKWLAAEDIYRMVRELDVAMNGINGAAKQASLCDIFEDLKEYIEAAKADVVIAPWLDTAAREIEEHLNTVLPEGWDSKWQAGNIEAILKRHQP